jgi:hypothetical protein
LVGSRHEAVLGPGSITPRPAPWRQPPGRKFDPAGLTDTDSCRLSMAWDASRPCAIFSSRRNNTRGASAAAVRPGGPDVWRRPQETDHYRSRSGRRRPWLYDQLTDRRKFLERGLEVGCRFSKWFCVPKRKEQRRTT